VGAGPELSGRTVLVVEDEYFIAMEVTRSLQSAGATVLGPFSRVRPANDAIAGGGPIHVALLDLNLSSEMAWPLVDLLLKRAVPVVLATGYGFEALPARYAALPLLAKPYSSRALTRAVADQVRKAA
jgi:DNA-binding NtrC family response regulator